MADNSNTKCNFHNKDYKLYCKECKDCICMECLDNDLHHMHSFCKLKDARNDILKELQTFIAENGEHHSETAEHFSKALKRKIEEFKDDELLIKTQVIVGAEDLIRHIKASKDELLTSLEKRFYEYNEHIKTVQDSLKTICSDIDNVDPDTIKDNQVVDLLVEMRRCISTCKNLLSKDEKPTFIQNPNCAVGYFTYIPKDNENTEAVCKSNDENDLNNKPHKFGVSVAVQTDYYDSIIAKEPEENQIETSSDEIQENYPTTISFDNEKEEIDKIIPISDQDAWVIINRQVRKIKNRVLESTKYVAADDFVVLKDGSVVVLNKYDIFIKKLLLDGRVVPFSCMNNCTARSLGLTENSVFINMCYYDHENSRTVFSNMNSFSFDGIISSTRNLFALNLIGTPKSAVYINGSFCILGRYSFGNNTLSTIYLVSPNEKDNESTNSADVKSFQGIFGMSPSIQFKCNGVCIDKNNTILVSDTTYRCVYALDENMKFKNFVLSNSDYDLESPGAIAIYNDHLWVVDGKKILIFRYEVNEIK
ncbi:unnamed protein product [Mytilus coruscus]|uniref:B box-type domain-containing protein n=1 Tax=Mytilus coruscus TaxID=42192 RepID=A0A6J8CCW1_MYTCO|nr:unnamed protein product [Mytilus coruscus]